MPDKNTNKNQAPAQKKEADKLQPKTSGKRIMIAEDEHALAHALELKLTHEGYGTKIVEDGARALESVEEFKPHLILLDLIMPKMDGFKFLEEIKNSKNAAPVIVLSNLGQDEDKKRAESFGVQGYFVKANTPIAEIVKKIKSLI